MPKKPIKKIVSMLIILLVIVAGPGNAQTPMDCPFCVLTGKNFSGQDLTDANFNGAILDGANFSGATLNGAMFNDASLVGANFNNAHLDPSSFGPANLSGANLTTATFQNASMTGAVLEYSDMSGTVFIGADLTRSLPGLGIRYDAGARAPNFSRAKIGCEYRVFESIIDLTTAAFSCKIDPSPLKPPTAVAKVLEEVQDRGKPVRMLVTVASPNDSTNDKRKNKAPGAAPTASGDTIYVMPGGTDNNTCGSLGSPCKTIGQGITNVNAGGMILVDYGQYVLTATLTISKTLRIIGGCNNGQPTPYQSQVTAPPNGAPAFNVSGNDVHSILSNLIVNGTIPTTTNTASICMQIMNSAVVRLTNMNINAAKGAQGNPGVQPGIGSAGNNGTAGSNGTGGGGGTSPSGDNTGGYGGNQSTKASSACDCGFACFTCTSKSSAYVYNGGSGNPGTTGKYTAGSSYAQGINYNCPYKDRPSPASKGNDGVAASCGIAGTPSSNTTGSFSLGQTWMPAISNTGGTGGNGAGGGGGGCGGTCHYCNCVCGGSGDFYNGTAGGGGGAGGVGAAGGSGGTQGGASIDLVIQAATCGVDGSVKITSGAGGNGGVGGGGNSGGKGGSGGAAQQAHDVCNDTGSQGGDGGSGGAGGASGGGAGGNGGPAICVALVGQCNYTGSSVYYSGQSGSIGDGGASGVPNQDAVNTGASCNGAKGNPGQPGTVTNVQQF